MNKNIEEISNRVKSYCENIQRYDEEMFNLGIELGRQLNEQKIDDFRLKIWSDIENDNSKEVEIRNAVDKVENFLAMLVRFSIAEHIEETGSWSIAKDGGYRLEKFSDEIVNKYNVQVLSCDMESYGGEFIVDFEVTDDLKKKFTEHKIYTMFNTRIYNENGEEEQTLHDVKRVDKYIHSVNAHIRNSNNWELEKYEEFLDEISKSYLFLITKNIW